MGISDGPSGQAGGRADSGWIITQISVSPGLTRGLLSARQGATADRLSAR
jgi:hypothetical protein